MAPFLSPAWVAALAHAAQVAEVDPDVRLTVRQVVDDAGWTIRVAGGRVAVDGAPGEGADVTFVADRATAEALVRGTLGAQDALLVGRLQVHGDVAALLRAAPALSVLEDLFASVRSETTYD